MTTRCAQESSGQSKTLESSHDAQHLYLQTQEQRLRAEAAKAWPMGHIKFLGASAFLHVQGEDNKNQLFSFLFKHGMEMKRNF